MGLILHLLLKTLLPQCYFLQLLKTQGQQILCLLLQIMMMRTAKIISKNIETVRSCNTV